MALSLAAGVAVAETDPPKREAPAKDAAIEKVEPRGRVLERAPPPIMTGTVRPEPATVPPRPARAQRITPPPAPPPAPPPLRRLEPTMQPAPMPEHRPAVDGVNAAAAGFGGAFDGRAWYGAAASLTVPHGAHYGIQLDGLATRLDSRFAGTSAILGAAGHLFWRDPATGVLGLYGHYAHAGMFGGVSLHAGGVQGAKYLGRWSIDAVAGVEGGGSATGTVRGAPLRLDIETRFFDTVSLSHYPNDDLRLSVGQTYTGGRHSIDFGAEWALPASGGTAGALFTQGSALQGGDFAIVGGLRLYFGQRPKSLIARHREDTRILGHPAARPLISLDP